MQPYEIVDMAERLSKRKPHEGSRRQITVSVQDWEALRDYIAQFEPITEWPMPEREPVTRLVIYGIPVITSQSTERTP